MRKVLIIISLLYSMSSSAQLIDSIRVSFHRKVMPTCDLNTQYSFITGIKSPILGLKLGVDFDGRVGLGGGYNDLDTPLFKNKIFVDSTGKLDTVKNGLHLTYLSYYVNYVFFKTNRWKFRVQLQVGLGNSRYEYQYNKLRYLESQKNIILYEPAILGQFKVFKWIGFSAIFGYRIMIINNKAIPFNFNSPIYNFGIAIFYGELYKILFPNTKLAKML